MPMPTTFHSRSHAAFEEVGAASVLTVEKYEIDRERERPLTEGDTKLIDRYMGPGAVDEVRDHLLDAERTHLSWRTFDHRVHGEFARKDLGTCLSGQYMPCTDERLTPAEQLGMDEIKTLEESFPDHDYTDLRARLEERL